MPTPFFETTVPQPELDPIYAFIRDDPYQEETRRYLDGLWTEYVPYADRNFLDRFQRRGQFHARTWEMRLTVVLKWLGLPVRPRSGAAGPDIRIEGQPPVWIEAVTPSSTAELRKFYEAAKRAPVPVPSESILLRYTQALQSKWDRYNDYLREGVVAPSEGYIIAISGSALPLPSAPGQYGEPPSIAHALYGIGPYRWQIEIGTGRVLEAGWSHRPATQKATGAPVESDLFLGDKRAGVSAVLYSPNDVQNRPQVYGRVEGWDLLIFHNEFAAIPLSPGLIKRGQEWGTKDGELRILHDYRNWTP